MVYDARTLEQLKVYTSFPAPVNVAKFSKESTIIGIGGDQDNIHLMRVSDYSILNTSIQSGQGAVFELDFLNGGAHMVSCGNNNRIKLYSVSGSNVQVVDTSNDMLQVIISCQCPATGNQVAFGGVKGNAIHYFINTGSNNFMSLTWLNSITANSFKKGIDWNDVTKTANFVGGDQNLEIWNVSLSTSTKINIGKDINNVNIAKDGTYAAMVGVSGMVEIWSLKNNSIETSFSESAGTNVTASAVSPDS